jgi:hypothetical protein
MSTKKSTKARAKKPARKTTAKRAAAAKQRPAKPTKPRDPKAPAVGTKIARRFKGKDYELKVTAEGYALGDVTFKSLTAAARAVTSYAAVSGPRFWLGTGTGKGGA